MILRDKIKNIYPQLTNNDFDPNMGLIALQNNITIGW
jgi:hypothetical protein